MIIDIPQQTGFVYSGMYLVAGIMALIGFFIAWAYFASPLRKPTHRDNKATFDHATSYPRNVVLLRSLGTAGLLGLVTIAVFTFFQNSQEEKDILSVVSVIEDNDVEVVSPKTLSLSPEQTSPVEIIINGYATPVSCSLTVTRSHKGLLGCDDPQSENIKGISLEELLTR